MSSAPLPRGAVLLLAHLKRTGQTPSAFCRKYGLSRVHIHYVLKGARRRLNPDLIFQIEDATGGEVPARAWCAHDVGAGGGSVRARVGAQAAKGSVRRKVARRAAA